MPASTPDPQRLSELLRSRGQMPAPTAIDVVAQVAELVEAVHRDGAVQGSLRPVDVLVVVTDDGLRAALAPPSSTALAATREDDVQALGRLLLAVMLDPLHPAIDRVAEVLARPDARAADVAAALRARFEPRTVVDPVPATPLLQPASAAAPVEPAASAVRRSPLTRTVALIAVGVVAVVAIGLLAWSPWSGGSPTAGPAPAPATSAPLIPGPDPSSAPTRSPTRRPTRTPSPTPTPTTTTAKPKPKPKPKPSGYAKARGEVLTAAQTFVARVSTYRPAGLVGGHLTALAAEVEALSTPAYASSFAATLPALEAQVAQGAASAYTPGAAAVSRVSRSTAVALVVGSTAANPAGGASQTVPERVVIDLVHEGGRWLVDGMTDATGTLTPTQTGIGVDPGDLTGTQAAAARDAAVKALPLLASYDYRTIVQTQTQALTLVAPAYRPTALAAFQAVRSQAAATKAVVQVGAVTAGVVTEKQGTAQVLVVCRLVSQSSVKPSTSGATAFVVSLDREGDAWLVSDLERY